MQPDELTAFTTGSRAADGPMVHTSEAKFASLYQPSPQYEEDNSYFEGMPDLGVF